MFYTKMHMYFVCVCACIFVHSLHGQNKEFCSILFCLISISTSPFSSTTVALIIRPKNSCANNNSFTFSYFIIRRNRRLQLRSRVMRRLMKKWTLLVLLGLITGFFATIVCFSLSFASFSRRCFLGGLVCLREILLDKKSKHGPNSVWSLPLV